MFITVKRSEKCDNQNLSHIIFVFMDLWRFTETVSAQELGYFSTDLFETL